MDYQILVPDLNGTLTNRDKIIAPETKMMLMRLQKQGEKVVLTSSRPTYNVLPLAKELELEVYGGYILSYNRGVIMDRKTGETVFSRCTPMEYNAAIIRLTVDQGVNILTYEEDKIIALGGACPYVAKEPTINKLRVEARVDIESYVTLQVLELPMLDDGDYLVLVETQMKAKFGKPFNIYRPGPYSLEIMPRGIGKAQSLGCLLESIGLGREWMIVCGDGHNDLTMIQYAGLRVAMENAILPLKQTAGYVTLSNNDDGIVHVVEKLILS